VVEEEVMGSDKVRSEKSFKERLIKNNNKEVE